MQKTHLLLKHIRSAVQKNRAVFLGAGVLAVVLVGTELYAQPARGAISKYGTLTVDLSAAALLASSTPPAPKYPPLDRAAYDAKLLALANMPAPAASSTATSTPPLWPVKALYPLDGAILPHKRIIAFYGNLYSTKMGVLGEYPKDVMLAKLASTSAAWEAADPSTPVQPALHYIVATAQGSPGADGKYRFRMPKSEIDKVLAMADEAHAIVFLDIQMGLSNIQTELPVLEPYLLLPNVHLGIDPEFAMKNGAKPGTVIGTLDAADVNFASNYMAKLVQEHNLPPKILVLHRFTQNMLTNYKKITPLPEVQIVVEMDGWGSQARKKNTYKEFVYKQPVQFAGFKLFYKNDFREKNSRIMTPQEVLSLTPIPSYIQYQ